MKQELIDKFWRMEDVLSSPVHSAEPDPPIVVFQKLRVSQGLAKKIQLDIMYTNSECHLKDLRVLDAIDDTKNTNPVALTFGYIDAGEDRVSRFLEYSEITQIEDNLPVCSDIAKYLATQVDFVHDSFAS